MTDIVVVDNSELITVVDKTVEIIAVNDPGVDVIAVAQQGPAGPPGPGGTQYVNLHADQALGGHRAVIATETGCNYADNTNPFHANRIVGITESAVGIGVLTAVVTAGPIAGYDGLTFGQPIYVSTIGTLTQTPPTTGFVQRIGTATSATDFVVQIQPAIIQI